MGIINIPAPAGSALAGQIQMQQLNQLGQALGMAFGRRQQGQLTQQDIQSLSNYFRNMQVAEQAQDVTGGGHWPGSQPSFPNLLSRQGQGMGLQMFDPLYQARLQSEKARTAYWGRPTSSKDVDRDLRAAEILAMQGRYAPAEEQPQYRKRVDELVNRAIESLNPEDKSPGADKRRKRAGKIIDDANRTISPTQTPPTAGRRDETSVIGDLMQKPALTPKPKRTNIFDRYPAPKDDAEFERTLSHIPKDDNKKLYFETMLKKLATTNPVLMQKLYDKYSDEIYK